MHLGNRPLVRHFSLLLGSAFLLGSLGDLTFAQSVSSVTNLSTRMVVQTGDNVLISGFIINGSAPKKLLLRALGPSLPVPGTLSDPRLELHDASGALIASNDNWRSTQQAEILATNKAPSNDSESALIATLAPGLYTVIAQGVNNTSGVALLEVYDLDPPDAPSRLANLSTRGKVLVDDNVMIGGFIVSGSVPKKMIMRVLGPSLYLNGVPIPGSMSDPTLELHDGKGAIIGSNDNWRTNQQTEIQASTLAPNDDREPALIYTFTPGVYTAIVHGANRTTGVALLEMYDLDQPPQADGSTLFVTEMRAQSGTTSMGSGTAVLRLSDDEKSAVLSFNFSNLSSPVTGMHIHGTNGTIWFDVDAATPQPDGSYIWVFTPVGSTTVADIVAAIKAGGTYL
ncbi:MAG: CHRD domain-containing protein, partial [Verrucomicrobiota bacterium]|nr:CHRD domain-containing protein [Verrucomicrobiota bacterium]